VGTYSAAVTATELRAGNNMSSSAQNGIYNFAAGDPASATDRAVGGISSGTASKSVNIYVQLTNNGSSTINNFTISYNVEKIGGELIQLVFQYKCIIPLMVVPGILLAQIS
jgi:hypothetical protein